LGKHAEPRIDLRNELIMRLLERGNLDGSSRIARAISRFAAQDGHANRVSGSNLIIRPNDNITWPERASRISRGRYIEIRCNHEDSLSGIERSRQSDRRIRAG
jgi:hypothetical protein